MTKKRRDIIASGFLILFAAVYFALSFTIEIKDKYGGSALVPRICSGIIVICALTLIYRALKMPASQAQSSVQSAENAAAPEPLPNYKLVVLTLFSIAAYSVLFNIIGFIPSTFLYLVVQILLLMPDKTKKSVMIAIIASVIVALLVYLLFMYVFYVSLPTGTIWQGGW